MRKPLILTLHSVEGDISMYSRSPHIRFVQARFDLGSDYMGLTENKMGGGERLFVFLSYCDRQNVFEKYM